MNLNEKQQSSSVGLLKSSPMKKLIISSLVAFNSSSCAVVNIPTKTSDIQKTTTEKKEKVTEYAEGIVGLSVNTLHTTSEQIDQNMSNVEVTRFNIYKYFNIKEESELQKLGLRVVGTIEDKNLKNIRLVDTMGTVLARGESKNKKIDFVFEKPFPLDEKEVTLPDGNKVGIPLSLSVITNIEGGANKSFKFALDPENLVVIGKESKKPIRIKDMLGTATYNDDSETNGFIINEGTLVVDMPNSFPKEVLVRGEEACVLTVDLKAIGEDILIDAADVRIPTEVFQGQMKVISGSGEILFNSDVANHKEDTLFFTKSLFIKKSDEDSLKILLTPMKNGTIPNISIKNIRIQKIQSDKRVTNSMHIGNASVRVVNPGDKITSELIENPNVSRNTILKGTKQATIGYYPLVNTSNKKIYIRNIPLELRTAQGSAINPIGITDLTVNISGKPVREHSLPNARNNFHFIQPIEIPPQGSTVVEFKANIGHYCLADTIKPVIPQSGIDGFDEDGLGIALNPTDSEPKTILPRFVYKDEK